MPRGRAWQHSDDLSHQAWLKVLQGKRPPAEKWPQPSKQGQPTLQPRIQDKVRGLHPDVKVSVARDRISKLETALAAVGEDDETAPKLQEALRKARHQAQTPPVEVRVKSCENFLERARKNVSKSQEEVARAQQALTEAQQNHAKWVAEVAQAEQRLITLQTEAAIPCATASTEQAQPDWAAELQQLREKVNELQIQNLELKGSCKRQAVGIATPVSRGGPRLTEDFVPKATMAGNPHEVARLCHVMGTAATSRSTVTIPPSMVSNAVR